MPEIDHRIMSRKNQRFGTLERFSDETGRGTADFTDFFMHRSMEAI
jgi:hypothetical protein